MARNALTRIAAITTILIASSMLTGCPGSLENPERFGPAGGGADAGGGGGGNDAGTPPVDEPDAGGEPALTHTQVFEAKCGGAGCHGAASPAVGLDLVSAGLRDRTVEVAARNCSDRLLVVPGNAEESYLYEKVAETSPQCGGRMPLGGGGLTDEELTAIRVWIEGL